MVTVQTNIIDQFQAIANNARQAQQNQDYQSQMQQMLGNQNASGYVLGGWGGGAGNYSGGSGLLGYPQYAPQKEPIVDFDRGLTARQIKEKNDAEFFMRDGFSNYISNVRWLDSQVEYVRYKL